MRAPGSAPVASPPAASTPAAFGPDRFLRTDHLAADLAGRSVRGGAVTMTAQALGLVLHLSATVILARLLTPGDYGLVAMVTAVTGFAALFQDAGLSAATVQRAEVTHAQVSTLFWVNVAVSVVLGSVVAALAPAVAWFYGEPRLTAVTAIAGATFLFGGLAVQHAALLRRQMRFAALAGVQLGAQAVGLVVGLAAAWAGAGYWALVALSAASAAANATLVWLACGWRPGRPARADGVGGLLRFGGHLTGFNTANYVASNAANVLIGRWWGAGPLGLYSRAYALLVLPLRQVNGPFAAVMVPALSRLADDPVRRERAYLRSAGAVALATMPPAAGMAVAAPDVIAAALGPDWGGVVPIFRWLTLYAFVQPVCNTFGWLFLASGRTREMSRWGLAAACAVAAGSAAATPFGPAAVAAAYAAVGLASAPVLVAYLWRLGLLDPRRLPAALAPPAAVAAACGAAAWGVAAVLPPEAAPLARLTAEAAAGLAAAVAAAFALPPTRRQLRDLPAHARRRGGRDD